MFDLRLDRGLSDFNVSHTLVIAGTWQIPGARSLTGPLAWVAKGWETSMLLKANTGVPFTPTFGTDGDPLGLGSTDPWAFPNRLGGPGCSSLVNPGNPNQYIKTECFAVPTAPNLAFYNANCNTAFGSTNPQDPTYLQCFNLGGNAGRNILIGPGLVNLDFSLTKNTRIQDSLNVQFRAEAFNILNRANYQVPPLVTGTDIFDSTGAPNANAGVLYRIVTYDNLAADSVRNQVDLVDASTQTCKAAGASFRGPCRHAKLHEFAYHLTVLYPPAPQKRP